METEEQGVTPEINTNTPTVTVETPVQTPIVKVEDSSKKDLDSANNRIGQLNEENKNYRLLKNAVELLGATPETLKAKLEEYQSKIESYEKFGNAEEISTKFKTLESEATEYQKLKTEQLVTQAGYKPLLADFAMKNGFQIKQIDAKDSKDKPIKVTVAVTTDVDSKSVETPVEEFLTKNYSDYLPAFKSTQTTTRNAVYAPTPSETLGEAEKQKIEKKGLMGSRTVTRNAF